MKTMRASHSPLRGNQRSVVMRAEDTYEEDTAYPSSAIILDRLRRRPRAPVPREAKKSGEGRPSMLEMAG